MMLFTTLELADGNQTKDSHILELTNREDRILVTKDSDFQLSFELGKGPPKLLLVTAGNIGNTELLSIFSRNASTLIGLLQQHDFIEVNHSAVIVHQ